MALDKEMVIFTRTFDFLSWLLPITADPWVSWQLSVCSQEEARGLFP